MEQRQVHPGGCRRPSATRGWHSPSRPRWRWRASVRRPWVARWCHWCIGSTPATGGPRRPGGRRRHPPSARPARRRRRSHSASSGFVSVDTSPLRPGEGRGRWTGRQTRLGDRRHRLGVLTEVAQLAFGRPGIGAHGDDARRRAREPRQQELGAVLEVDDDPLTGADTALVQAGGQPGHVGGELTVRPCPPGPGKWLPDQERMIPPLLGPDPEEPRERAPAPGVATDGERRDRCRSSGHELWSCGAVCR